MFGSHVILGALFIGYVCTSVDADAERRISETPTPVDALKVTSRIGNDCRSDLEFENKTFRKRFVTTFVVIPPEKVRDEKVKEQVEELYSDTILSENAKEVPVGESIKKSPNVHPDVIETLALKTRSNASGSTTLTFASMN